MNLKHFYIAFSIVVATLLFLATGYDGWGCGGSAFSGGCKHMTKMQTIGGLLISAAVANVLVALFICLQITKHAKGTSIASLSVAIASTILSMAGVFYYYDQLRIWSPFIATTGMTISFVLTALITVDFVNGPRY